MTGRAIRYKSSLLRYASHAVGFSLLSLTRVQLQFQYQFQTSILLNPLMVQKLIFPYIPYMVKNQYQFQYQFQNSILLNLLMVQKLIFPYMVKKQ